MDPNRHRKNPNVFGQLRSLTNLLTKEPPRLQHQLDNPPSFDEDTARLVLKETRRDVKKLAGEARGHLTRLQDSSTDFNNLLDVCGKLVAKKKEKLEKIEQHMQKYGYTPYRDANSTSNRKVLDSEDKENQPEPEECGDTLRNSPSAANDRLDKMPSLAEFGISQATLAFLNKRGSKNEIDSRTQVFKHPITQGKKMGESDDTVSPFDQESGVLVTPGIGLRMFESTFMTGADQFASPAPPVFTTPRVKEMFNSNKKRHPSMDETFVVKSSPHLTNPEMPNFLTPSLQRFSRKQNQGQESCVPKMESLRLSPGAPQMSSSCDGLAGLESPKIFACRSGPGVSTQVRGSQSQESTNLPKPQEPSSYSSQMTNDFVVPDTPEMTCNFRFRNINVSEKQPVVAPTQNSSPEHLVSAIPDSRPAPVTPAAFNVPMPPESMKKYSNNDVVMPTPPRFYTETARKMFCDAELDNIPAPEVATPIPRADIVVPIPKMPRQQGTSGLHEINKMPAPCHVDTKNCDVGEPNLGAGRKRALPKRIAFITQDEYDQQPDYLQNTVSLETINKCIHKVNTFIRDKSEAGCGEDILSAELQNELGFGNHAKKLILLLLQVKRISQQKVGVYSITDE